MWGWSDITKLNKMQTLGYKCNHKCTKERGMKTANELFEPDTRLRPAMEAKSLPHWTDLTCKRKRSQGWDKNRRVGRLSSFHRSVVMDPGPGLWQGNLIKHAILETHARPACAHTHTHPQTKSFCQIWINTNTHRSDCGMQLGDLGRASGIFGHLRSPVKAWMQDDSKREPAASGDLSPSMHLSHKQILPSLYSD